MFPELRVSWSQGEVVKHFNISNVEMSSEGGNARMVFKTFVLKMALATAIIKP